MRTKLLCAFVLPFCLIFAPRPVHAQGVGQSAVSGAALAERYPLLSKKVTLEAPSIKMSRFLKELSQVSGIELTCESPLSGEWLRGNLKRVPIGDVMRAVALMYDGAWVGADRKYRLVQLIDSTPFRGPLEEEVNRHGLEVASLIRELPEEMQQRLADSEAVSNVPLAELPVKLRNAIGGAVEAESALKEWEWKASGFPIAKLSATELGGAVARFQVKPSGAGWSAYHLQVGVGRSGGEYLSFGMAFDDSQAVARKQREDFQKGGALLPEEARRKVNDSTDNAGVTLEDPILAQQVDVALRAMPLDAAVVEIMKQIPDTSYLVTVQISDGKKVYHSPRLSMPQVKLSAFLDKIIGAEQYLRWEIVKGDILIVRPTYGADNSN